MKRIILMLVLILILMFGTGMIDHGNHDDNYRSFDEKELENFITYRIWYIRQIAYNSDRALPKERARGYAKCVIKWSEYFGERMNENIDPLLVLAVIESETNFVSKSTYDNGDSLGIMSMKRSTGREIAKKLDERYSDWKMLDATAGGIKYTVYYLGKSYQRFGYIEYVVNSYNLGRHRASQIPIENVYYKYTYRVLGRYNNYYNVLRKFDDVKGYFKNKL